MRTFYFMGANAANISGKSWKLWKVERRGREVQAWWGRATIDKRRRVVPNQELQTKIWRFRSEDAAINAVESRIAEKLREGYKPDRG